MLDRFGTENETNMSNRKNQKEERGRCKKCRQKIKGDRSLLFYWQFPPFFLGRQFPIVGGPVFRDFIGFNFRLLEAPRSFNDGISFTSKKFFNMPLFYWGSV